MNVLQAVLSLFKKPLPFPTQLLPHASTYLGPVYISEFDGVWNELAVELAKPRLRIGATVDEEKVRHLEEKLATLQRQQGLVR